MRVMRYIPPYKANGKTQFRDSILDKSGVYLIKEDDRLVYVGYSAKNLYKTLYRHFEQWNHSQQKVTSYANRLRRKKYTVRVILCTPLQAERLERALVIRHKPRDNDQKYEQYRLELQDKTVVKQYEQTEVEVPF